MLDLKLREQFSPQIIHDLLTIVGVQLIRLPVHFEMLIHQSLGQGMPLLVRYRVCPAIPAKTIFPCEHITIPLDGF